MGKATNNQELRSYISSTSFEEVARVFYSSGKARALYGENSVMLRALGERFQGADSYQRNYFDEFRGKEVMTEFGEFCEALRDYDNSQTNENLVEMILEAGDLLFQSTVINLRHKENPQYPAAREQMDEALLHVESELKKRGLSIETVNRIAIIKYGVRSYNCLKGLPVKDKNLEMKLCLEEIEKL